MYLHIDLSWLGLGDEEDGWLQTKENRTSLRLALPQVVAEPFETLVKSVARGGTG